MNNAHKTGKESSGPSYERIWQFFSFRPHIFLVLILISGLILRLAGMNDPLTYDEAYTYVAFASRSLWVIVSDYSLPNNHIFHSLLVHFSSVIFGNHPWSIRIPALLAGLMMTLVAYKFGQSIYSRESGLAAAALVAYFPALVNFSSEARGYSLVGLFTLLIFWLGWQIAHRSGQRAWGLLALCTALGFWTVPIMLFPAGGLYLWLFLEGLKGQPANRRAYYTSWLLSGLGAGLLTGLLYTPVVLISGWRQLLANGFVQPVDAKKYFDWVLETRLIDTWQTWIKDIPLLLTVVLLLGFALALIFHWRITSGRVPLQLVVFGWIALLVIARRPDAYDRFWSFLIAPLLVWSAAGIIETAKRLRMNSLPLGGIFAGLAIVFLIIQSVSSIASLQARWEKMGNPEAAAIYLKDILQPDDIVLAGYPNNAPLWYYLDLYGLPERTWQARTDASNTYFVLAANQKGQTLEAIVKSYKLDPALFVLERAEPIQRYGQMIIYRLGK